MRILNFDVNFLNNKIRDIFGDNIFIHINHLRAYILTANKS